MNDKGLEKGEKYVSVQLDNSCLAEMIRCAVSGIPCRIAFFPNKNRITKTHPSFKSKWGAVWFQEKKETLNEEIEELPEELL